jgi:uncharacterized damage-inducible protein DinB
MVFRDVLLAELDHEMAVTRLLLERLPEAAMGWRPREGSRTLGELAAHLAHLPNWASSILERESYDLARDDRRPGLPGPPASRADVLAAFDSETARARRVLAGRTDAELGVPWSLTRAGQPVMSLPRFAAMRSLFICHLVHHRGQLSVYFRMQDVSLPPMYGAASSEPV